MESYAVIDVETTGLSPKTERLTEIAIVILEDGNIVDEYSTLINPEKKVPYRITQLTGINTQMVQDAPYFYEIAKKVVEITEGRTFVAHNASFDYRFIQAEFARYGLDEASQQISQLEADPNPFSSTTNIHFQLFKAGQVGLSIYDIAGKEIFSSGNEWKSQGDQIMNWNGQNS